MRPRVGMFAAASKLANLPCNISGSWSRQLLRGNRSRAEGRTAELQNNTMAGFLLSVAKTFHARRVFCLNCKINFRISAEHHTGCISVKSSQRIKGSRASGELQ